MSDPKRVRAWYPIDPGLEVALLEGEHADRMRRHAKQAGLEVGSCRSAILIGLNGHVCALMDDHDGAHEDGRACWQGAQSSEKKAP